MWFYRNKQAEEKKKIHYTHLKTNEQKLNDRKLMQFQHTNIYKPILGTANKKNNK